MILHDSAKVGADRASAMSHWYEGLPSFVMVADTGWTSILVLEDVLAIGVKNVQMVNVASAEGLEPEQNRLAQSVMEFMWCGCIVLCWL